LKIYNARAFSRLANEFKFTHNEIAKKIGRSREYVSNTLRILALPEEILTALAEGKISEGHTRPLLMLIDHPEEQIVLFKEILYKKITVREAEKIARKIAYDRVRKKKFLPDLEIIELEEEFQDKLGTRVHIDRHELGGQIKIDYFSTEDLRVILDSINKSAVEKKPEEMLQNYIDKNDFEEKNKENLEQKETSDQENLSANLSIEKKEDEKIESLNPSELLEINKSEYSTELPKINKSDYSAELSEVKKDTNSEDNSKINFSTNINEDKKDNSKIDSLANINENKEDTNDDTKLYDISNFSI